MVDYDPSSFKDPAGRVFFEDGRVYRALTETGAAAWRALADSGLVKTLSADGRLVPTHAVDRSVPGAALCLEHERIPFLSYAHEWPFALLRRAALFHLDLLSDILPHGFEMKDATPFNIQFRGRTPVLIDVLSIEKRVDGDPWAGYGQFCDTMLNPLLLTAHLGVPYQTWLRADPNGLAAAPLARMLGLRKLFRPGVLLHVRLRAFLERSLGDTAAVDRSDFRKAKFSAAAVLKNVAGLRRIIEGLRAPALSTHWGGYERDNSYAAKADEEKRSFVSQVVGSKKRAVVFDIGCNRGRYSEIAAPNAGLVVAMDADEQMVDAVVARLDSAGIPNVLPLVVDWANPSPGLGWRSRERRALLDRGRADLALYLAVIHHLALSRNVPLDEQMSALASAANEAVVEWVDPADAMCRKLMRNNEFSFPNYTRAVFLAEAGRFFSVVAERRLSETREIFHLRRREG